jgi:hypothetical protein
MNMYNASDFGFSIAGQLPAATLTADQIERKVERAIDALDRAFLAGRLSQEAYDAEIVAWDKWADQQYRAV